MTSALQTAYAEALAHHVAALGEDDRRFLAALLAPCTPAAFFAEHWDRAPLHANGSARAGVPTVMGLEELEELLAHGRLPLEQVEVIGGSEAGPAPRRTSFGRPQLDLRRLADAVQHHGRGIRVHGLEAYVPSVQRFAGRLGTILGARVAVNGYYTTPRVRGLPLHWDTHDVLVLQVHGTKHWVLHEPPIERPIAPHHSSTGYAFEPGEPSWEGQVSPGELLYVPRGTPHTALATTPASLHLAVGIVVPTWHDVLARLAAAALAQSAEEADLRRPAPLFLGDGALVPAAVGELLAVLGRELQRAGASDAQAQWRQGIAGPEAAGRRLSLADPSPPGSAPAGDPSR